jgi:hypothetical protein
MGTLDGIFNNSSTLNIASFKRPAPVAPQFYWHINVEELSVVAIAPYPPTTEGIVGIKLDEKRANDLINGIESVNEWRVFNEDSKVFLRHESEIEKEKLERLKALLIYEVTDDSREADIRVIVNSKKHPGAILVYYNGNTIYNWNKPAKIYVTRENDPSYLKCTLTLSPAALDKIIEKNKLEEWPNPIVLPIEDADDVSIYTARSNHTIAIHRNENTNNRI